MSAAAVNVFGIAGSLRRDSFNRSLLRFAAECAPDGVVVEVYDGLDRIPHFNQDTEGDRTPAEVLDFCSRIGAADAVLVSTPEYNSAMPGVLKNALDWASRPPGESVLTGRPAAVMGASPGRFGAVRAQEQARMVLTAIGAEVLDRELPVARAHERIDGDGRLVDEEIAAGVADLVAAVVESAGGPSAAEQAASAAYSLACQQRAAS